MKYMILRPNAMHERKKMKKSEDNNSRTKEASLAGSLFLLCYISEPRQ